MDTVNQPFRQSGKPFKDHLIRSASLVGVLTLLSRVLGMVRDVVNANFFGTTWQWDAFLYAFMIPNFFRRIAAEGALSSAFIPIYGEVLSKEGKEGAFRYANTIACLLFLGLSLFFIGAEALCHYLLKLNFMPERLALTFRLTTWLLPYLGFISLASLAMGVLNSHKHFFSANLGPIILNVFWIAGVFWLMPNMNGPIEWKLHGLAWIILLAGFLQLVVQMPSLWKLGFRFQWLWDTGHLMIRKTWNLLIPAIFSFSVVQINLMVDMTLAFWVGPGATSSLWYGTRLMQLPLGVFAVAMGTALLPTIAEQAAQKDISGQRHALCFALKSVFFIVFPCSIGLIVLSRPIVQLLFQRGEFDALSTARTSFVLVCYAVGLFAYSGHKIMTTGFYANQETKTPVRIGVFALVSNFVLNFALIGPLKEAGLALSTSLAGILQLILLIRAYEKKVLKFVDTAFLVTSLKIVFASLLMGGICHVFYLWLSGIFQPDSFETQFFLVFSSIAVGFLSYLFLSVALKVGHLGKILKFEKQDIKQNEC